MVVWQINAVTFKERDFVYNILVYKQFKKMNYER